MVQQYFMSHAKLGLNPRMKNMILEPGSGKAVEFGLYDNLAPEPNIQVSFIPNLGDEVCMSYEKLDLPGESRYVLLYQFQNFSSEACRITMALRD